MLDLLRMIAALERPRLLVQAARIGVETYRRTALKRLIEAPATIRPGEAILRLLEAESDLESRRLARMGGYSPARHVAVLIALLGEARLLRESLRPRLVA